jgi:hypothetical protein
VIDSFGRGKWAFWLFVCVLAALAAAPSALLLHTAQSYIQFITGTNPGTIKPTRVDFLDRRRNPQTAVEKKLEFIEFSLKADKAKSVELTGDFNGWKTGGLLLARNGKTWEIMLPLLPGRYHYLFRVDGKTQLDPHARSEKDKDGKKVSVRRIP